MSVLYLMSADYMCQILWAYAYQNRSLYFWAIPFQVGSFFEIVYMWPRYLNVAAWQRQTIRHINTTVNKKAGLPQGNRTMPNRLDWAEFYVLANTV